MLSASRDFVSMNPWQKALLGANQNSQRFLQTLILISSIYVLIFRGLRPSEFLNRGFSSGPHWGKLPDHFTGSLYTTLAQILSSYIKPSRSLRSLSTTISAPLRKTLQDLFHPMHLMSEISCLSMFPLPRHY